MYKVIVPGEAARYADSILYVKRHTNGCYVPCGRDDATGVCAKIAKTFQNQEGRTVTTLDDVVYSLPDVEITQASGAMVKLDAENFFSGLLPEMSTEQIIQHRSLCKPWVSGSHTSGEVYTTEDGQIWECFQPYDNAVYPDIAPGGTSWGTFNRPYHGTTMETALPWVAPTGAHDIYNAGEYMIWTDGTVKKCIQSTNFSPEEYPAAWTDA